MEYLPLPRTDELAALGEAIGSRVSFQRRIPGGLSSTTDVLARDDERIVLRRHGPWWDELGIDVTRRERLVIAAAAGAGVPVPSVLWSSPDEIFGCPTLLTSFVDGSQVAVPDDEFSFGRQLAEAAARIHSIDPSPELSAILARGVSDFDRPPGFMEHPDAQRMLRRVEQSRPSSSVLTVIHGDFWPGNTLWRSGTLMAVVDWENAAYSDPAADIAYAATDLRYLGLDDAAAELVAHYRSITGSDLPTLDYWIGEALMRPMPDIGVWVPAWIEMGYPITHPDEVRSMHRRLIADYLG